MRLKTLLLVVVVSLSFTAGASAATTITVTSTADSTTGTCPSTTVCNLRAAVAEADSLANHADPPASVVIQLGAGTYPVTQGPLDVSAGLALSIVGKSAATTTIDASGNGAHDLIDENGYSASDSLALSDLSVTGVNATADEALQMQGGSFTATYVTFTENASTVIDNQSGGSVTLTGDTFSGDSGGYALYAASGATLSDDTFSNDSAFILVQLNGGGSISDLTFQNETGRALVLQGDQPYVVNGVVVTGGSNTDGYASLTLADSGTSPSSLTGLDVEGTTSDAGAVAFGGAWSTIDDVTVADNTVSAPDAGVALDLTGSATAENWTVADNTEPAGTASPLAGGIALTGGELALRFATVDGNSADGDGDDLYATGSGTALSVGDSILNGTAAGGAQECVTDSGATIASLGDNVDHAGTCLQAATDRDGVNPVLGSLTAHPGQSFLPNVEPLGYGSPAVDAVPLSSCPASDEDGDPRPAGTLCDAGAYESPLTKFGIAVTGAPATAVAGTAATYTVTADNASATTPQSAVITDTLPAGATLSSATVSVGGATAAGCSGTTTVSCPVGALRRGEQAVATITAVLESAGTDTDTASVTSELPDADDADDTSTASTVVSAPAGSGASGSGGGGPGSGGSGSGGSGTGTTTTPTTTTSTTTTPAGMSSTGVTALSLAPARFTAKSGSTLTFRDGTAGRVTLTITRTARGVRAGKQCVAPPAHARRHAVACTRTLTVGSLTVTARVGVNHLHFTALVHGRALASGLYTLHAGKRATVFTILPAVRRSGPHAPAV